VQDAATLHAACAAALTARAGFASLAVVTLKHAAALELVLFKQIGCGVAQQVALGLGQGVTRLKAASG
jgi:hypothetical protein